MRKSIFANNKDRTVAEQCEHEHEYLMKENLDNEHTKTVDIEL